MADAPISPLYKDRRTWLIVFGVVEFLIALLLLFGVAGIALTAFDPRLRSAQPARAILFSTMALYVVLAAFYVVAGIGSIRARNWARIAMIVASSLWLAMGVAASLFLAAMVPFIKAIAAQSNQTQLPNDIFAVVMIIPGLFMLGTMVALPLILLLFYTGRNVKATCLAYSPQNKPIPWGKIPLTVWAVWFACHAFATLVAGAWIPVTVIFGKYFHGGAARILFAIVFAVYVLCAYGYYKRDIRGWTLSLIYYIFWFLSALVGSFHMDPAEMYRQMGFPVPNPQILQIMRFAMPLSFIFMVIYIGLILYSRRYFFASPAHPADPSPQVSLSS